MPQSTYDHAGHLHLPEATRHPLLPSGFYREAPEPVKQLETGYRCVGSRDLAGIRVAVYRANHEEYGINPFYGIVTQANELIGYMYAFEYRSELYDDADAADACTEKFWSQCGANLYAMGVITPIAHIECIEVRHDLQGRGYGRILMDTMLSRWKRGRLQLVALDPFPLAYGKTASQRLVQGPRRRLEHWYNSFGFTTVRGTSWMACPLSAWMRGIWPH